MTISEGTEIIQAPKIQMIDFLTFQGRDVEIFKQAVERHNGAIQVLIHPLGMIPELDDPGEPVVSYFERLKSLIANSNPEIPIVAFIRISSR